MRRCLIAALAALCLLVAPAGALAQSAGDEQYADPFGDVNEPTQNDDTANGSPAPAAQGEAPASEPASESATASAADQGTGGSLPHTGFPAALGALLGALLLSAGATVRRRAQPPLALPPWLVPGTSQRGWFGARRRFRR